MAVIRWDPWGEVAALQRDVGTLFNRAFGQEAQPMPFVPPIDAWRTDEALMVRAELAGVDPSNVEIDVSDGVLTISGERRMEHTDQQAELVRRERAYGRFERGFTLPEGTDPDQISATFEHGVLQLTIPHPPQRRPRRIAISGAGSKADLEVTETAETREPVGVTA